MSHLAVITFVALGLSSVPAFAQTPVLESVALLHHPAIAQTIHEDKPGAVAYDVVVTAETRTRPTLLVPLYTAQVVLQSLDLYTTFRALGDGHREANPVFKSGNKGTMIGAKMAAAGFNAYLVEKMWKKKPKTAVLMMMAVNGLMSGIVANNTKVLSGR